MSVMEIFDCMQSYRRKRERDLKQELTNRFAAADYTARYVGSFLNSENKPAHPWDYFPSLFAKEKKAYEEQKEREQLEIARENRRAYAAEFNRRRDMGIV